MTSNHLHSISLDLVITRYLAYRYNRVRVFAVLFFFSFDYRLLDL